MTTPFYISISNIQRFLFLTSLLAPVVVVLVIVIMLLLSRFSCAQLFVTHGLQPTRLLRPWDFPGKSTGIGCHCLLQIVILVNVKWHIIVIFMFP